MSDTQKFEQALEEATPELLDHTGIESSVTWNINTSDSPEIFINVIQGFANDGEVDDYEAVCEENVQVNVSADTKAEDIIDALVHAVDTTVDESYDLPDGTTWVEFEITATVPHSVVESL